jgi:hypothetical protein
MSAAFTKKPVYRVIYCETYEPRARWVNADLLPAWMPHLNKGSEAAHVELRAAGQCTLDGKAYEFHDIRVYVDTSKESS